MIRITRAQYLALKDCVALVNRRVMHEQRTGAIVLHGGQLHVRYHDGLKAYLSDSLAERILWDLSPAELNAAPVASPSVASPSVTTPVPDTSRSRSLISRNANAAKAMMERATAPSGPSRSDRVADLKAAGAAANRRVS